MKIYSCLFTGATNCFSITVYDVIETKETDFCGVCCRIEGSKIPFFYSLYCNRFDETNNVNEFLICLFSLKQVKRLISVTKTKFKDTKVKFE